MTKDEKKNLPARRGAASIKKPDGSSKDSFLAKMRKSKAIAPSAANPLPTRGDPSLIAAALKPRDARPRLVFAIDATASREPAWNAARATTDALFSALPGQLDVALAVHGGSRLMLFSDFTSTPAALRDQAASIHCEAGATRLTEIMHRCYAVDGVRVLVYIGDVFEEPLDEAERAAAQLRLRGTRVIVLHDHAQAPAHDRSEQAFAAIAKMTGGAVLPFDAASITRLRELLEAIATLAVGGVRLLQQRVDALPAASSILKQLPDGR